MAHMDGTTHGCIEALAESGVMVVGAEKYSIGCWFGECMFNVMVCVHVFLVKS